VLLLEVPATSSANESWKGLGIMSLLPKSVPFVALSEVDLPSDSVIEVDLAIHHVFPGGRGGVLEVSHISPDVCVEGIHDHLPVGRAGDLNPAVDETGSRGSSLPGLILTNVPGLGEEVGKNTPIEFGLAVAAALEKPLPAAIEGAMEKCEEDDGLLSENLLLDGRRDLAEDGDVVEHLLGHGGSAEQGSQRDEVEER